MNIDKSFSDPNIVQSQLTKLKRTITRPLRLMEVCGTHTMSISRYSLRELLRDEVEYVSGPGCPVCVTATQDIDNIIHIAKLGATVATFGDMMRVPGSNSSLAQARALGYDIQVLYSPFEAVRLAAENPDRAVVLAAMGFETTVPVVATALQMAISQGLSNFYIYSAHKTVPPAIHTLLSGPHKLDGFLLPGHVCAISGYSIYDFISKIYGLTAVVAGFTPVEILSATQMIVDSINDNNPQILNAYPRVVSKNGNSASLAITDKYFTPDSANWRGLGTMEDSGLELREGYSSYNAKIHFSPAPPAIENTACRCGEVLTGQIRPTQCPEFNTRCKPEHPVGACMVSTEGSCAAYYRYERN